MAGRDLGEGTRLAAATGAWICFDDEAWAEPAPAEGPHLEPPRPHPHGHGLRQGLGPSISREDDQTRPGLCPGPYDCCILASRTHIFTTLSKPDDGMILCQQHGGESAAI